MCSIERNFVSYANFTFFLPYNDIWFYTLIFYRHFYLFDEYFYRVLLGRKVLAKLWRKNLLNTKFITIYIFYIYILLLLLLNIIIAINNIYVKFICKFLNYWSTTFNRILFFFFFPFEFLLLMLFFYLWCIHYFALYMYNIYYISYHKYINK